MDPNQEETGIASAVRLAGSQTALAKGISEIARAEGRDGVTPQAVQKWVAQGIAPSERCRDIERLLDMRVTRYRLNPAVFGSAEEAVAALQQQAEGAAP